MRDGRPERWLPCKEKAWVIPVISRAGEGMGHPGNLIYRREHGFIPVILYMGESMGFLVILHVGESMGIPVILWIKGTHLRGRADSIRQKPLGHVDRARCLNIWEHKVVSKGRAPCCGGPVTHAGLDDASGCMGRLTCFSGSGA